MQHFKPIAPIFFASLLAFSVANCHKANESSELVQTAIPTTQGLVTTNAVTRYVLEGNKVLNNPAQIRQKIASLGATETAYIPQLKMMCVSSSHPNFKTELEAINVTVAVDIDLQKTQRTHRRCVPPPPNTHLGNTNFYFTSLWGLKAIAAPAAWSLGYRGSGVKVAVLDEGFYVTHPDLAPNMNLSLAHNFVTEAGENNPTDVSFAATGFSHGTHVAGIIAAVDNTIGTVGVAPQAEIIPIKVLSDNSDSQVSWVVQGIMYAADHGADVINMSLGVTIKVRNRGRTAESDKVIIQLFKDAVKYAYDKGVTVICAAGNDAINFDHSNWEVFPAASPHSICIAATASENWVPGAANTNVNLDVPASYTNFGVSRIDFAAPGGDFDTSPDTGDDGILSMGDLDYYYAAAGTSQAAPHVAGVAALIIGKNGGTMSPAAVRAKLKQSADDLGSPGKDKYFGHGRVNAWKAVQ